MVPFAGSFWVPRWYSNKHKTGLGTTLHESLWYQSKHKTSLVPFAGSFWYQSNHKPRLVPFTGSFWVPRWYSIKHKTGLSTTFHENHWYQSKHKTRLVPFTGSFGDQGGTQSSIKPVWVPLCTKAFGTKISIKQVWYHSPLFQGLNRKKAAHPKVRCFIHFILLTRISDYSSIFSRNVFSSNSKFSSSSSSSSVTVAIGSS